MTQKNHDDDECMAVDLVNQMDDAISKLQIYAKHLHFAMRLHYISLCIHLLLLYIPMVMTWNCCFFPRHWHLNCERNHRSPLNFPHTEGQ